MRKHASLCIFNNPKKETVIISSCLILLFLLCNITISSGQAKTIYGLNASSYLTPYTDARFLTGLEASGAQMVRIELKYDIGEDYQLTKMLHEAGFAIIGVLGKSSAPWTGTPDWMPIKDVNHWTQISDHVLSQYQGIIDYVEVWNEPDLPEFSSGYMDGTPAHYMDLLKATCSVASIYDFPKSKIVGPSIAVMRNSSNTPSDFYGANFAKETVKLGIRDYISAANIHIYDWFLNGNEGLKSAKDVYERAVGIYDLPVWVTEIGNLQNQVDDVEISVEMNQWFNELQNRDCPVIIWYSCIDGWDTSGLMRENFSTKPQYTTFQSFAQTSLSTTSSINNTSNSTNSTDSFNSTNPITTNSTNPVNSTDLNEIDNSTNSTNLSNLTSSTDSINSNSNNPINPTNSTNLEYPNSVGTGNNGLVISKTKTTTNLGSNTTSTSAVTNSSKKTDTSTSTSTSTRLSINSNPSGNQNVVPILAAVGTTATIIGITKSSKKLSRTLKKLVILLL